MPELRRTAIITRAPGDDEDLAARLRSNGVDVIALPCVRIEPLADSSQLAREIGRLAADDWLVVTSRAGADAIARASRPRCRVAAIGGRTAARLQEHGIGVDFQPITPAGVALGRDLPLARVALLARSDRALADLPSVLNERGFEVREVIAYHTVARARGDIDAARAALADRAREVRTFVASPSAVEAFVDAVGEELAGRAIFVAIGATTAATAGKRVPTARVEIEGAVDVAHR